jgi:hypothetical protein
MTMLGKCMDCGLSEGSPNSFKKSRMVQEWIGCEELCNPGASGLSDGTRS